MGRVSATHVVEEEKRMGKGGAVACTQDSFALVFHNSLATREITRLWGLQCNNLHTHMWHMLVLMERVLEEHRGM